MTAEHDMLYMSGKMLDPPFNTSLSFAIPEGPDSHRSYSPSTRSHSGEANFGLLLGADTVIMNLPDELSVCMFTLS